jgi:undecaprenyl-diphosphatase
MTDLVNVFTASFMIWILFAGLGVLWVIDGRIKKEQVIHALLACLIAWLIAVFIKNFFPTVRPFMVNGNEIKVIIPPTDGAFPSAHTVVAFAVAVTVFMHNKRVGWIFLVWAFVIGTARVIANVHYPIDIVGGAFLGTIVAVLVEKVHLFKLLTKRR